MRSLFNMLGSIALVRLIAPFMDRQFTGGGDFWLWLALGIPAVLLLGGMLATILTVKERPGTGSTQFPSILTLRQSFKIDTRTHPDFILFLIASFLVTVGWAILQGHALYYLMDVLKLDRPGEITSNLIVIVGTIMVATVYPAGRLCDKVGHKPVAVFSAFLGAVGIAGLLFSRTYPHIMLSGAFLGAFGGAWMSSQWALATILVSKGEEARYLGLVNISIAGAGALSRLIGPAIDFFNSLAPNLGYDVMLLVCFVGFIAGSLLLVQVSRGRKLTKVA